ncbi:MAG: PAS domain-containing protein [Candidatus Hydrogenedentes bacterium]|nr:PAS domain-containing protein [Candidatus Hydrogenedentota bacterium]
MGLAPQQHDHLPGSKTLLLVVLATALLMLGGTYGYFRYEMASMREQHFGAISSVAELKAAQIHQWRLERIGDTQLNPKSWFFREALVEWQRKPDDDRLRRAFEEGLKLYETAYGYEDALLLSPDGTLLASSHPDPIPVQAETMRVFEIALREKDSRLSEFYLMPDGSAHIDVMGPVLDAAGKTLAMVLLRSDAATYLYPLIQTWPVPSHSAETFLIMRDGGEAVYLSELKLEPGSALTKRVPLSNTELPAVRAALGEAGRIQAPDYRGVEVLADWRAVPGTTWYLIAKVDASELLAETRYRTGAVGLVSLLCVLIVAITARLIHRRRQSELFAELYSSEREQREAEAQFRLILYSIGDGVITADCNARVSKLNAVAESLTGWAQEEALGKPITEVFRIVHAETRQPVECPVHRVLREGVVVGLANHTALLSKNGPEYQIADSGAPIRGEDGGITGVVLVFRDVTEEYARQRELAQMRSLLQNTLDSMPSALVAVDAQGQVIQHNMRAMAWASGAQGSAIDAPLEQAFPLLSRQLERVREAVATREVMEETKIPMVTDGETRYHNVTVFPLTENGVVGAVIRVDDVTDRVHLEEMMVQSEKLNSIGSLAAGMAHEINNPLGIMLQSAQNVVRRFSPDLEANRRVAEECGVSLAQVRRYCEEREIFAFIEDIREGGSRASAIVSNMLQFSRRSESRMQPASLPELIERTLDLASHDYDLKKKFDFRHVEIVRDYEEGLPLVPLIVTEIEQVILNILKNGAQAMSEGGTVLAADGVTHERPRFGIRVYAAGEFGAIDIEDNGPGMPEAVRRRIFEPFFTTKPVGSGTGLGLSVSYMIVINTHGGLLDVKSEPGRGTKFMVRLPLRRAGE